MQLFVTNVTTRRSPIMSGLMIYQNLALKLTGDYSEFETYSWWLIIRYFI